MIKAPYVGIFALLCLILSCQRRIARREVRRIPGRPANRDLGRTLEIRLYRKTVHNEGLGGVLSALRGVLIIQNATGAVITMGGKNSLKALGHGYYLRDFLNIGFPLPGKRRFCKYGYKQAAEIIANAWKKCDMHNISRRDQLFRNCNTFRVFSPLGHPKSCAAYTAPMVRNLWRYPLEKPQSQTDICVLRRGGDLEHKLNFFGHRYKIDLERTLPILEAARRNKKRIVLLTETNYPANILKLYRPNIFSNKEPLQVVLKRASRCKCLFASSGSSFAIAVAQISQPSTIIYTQPRTSWMFQNPFLLSDFGERAIPVTVPIAKIIQRCLQFNLTS